MEQNTKKKNGDRLPEQCLINFFITLRLDSSEDEADNKQCATLVFSRMVLLVVFLDGVDLWDGENET